MQKRLLTFIAVFNFGLTAWAIERPKSIDFSLKIDAARTDQMELQNSFKTIANGNELEVSEKPAEDVVEFFDAEIRWKKPSTAAKR